MKEFDICNYCKRTGKISNLKLYQINFEEAIYLCSQEECVYPLPEKNIGKFIIKRNTSDISPVKTEDETLDPREKPAANNILSVVPHSTPKKSLSLSEFSNVSYNEKCISEFEKSLGNLDKYDLDVNSAEIAVDSPFDLLNSFANIEEEDVFNNLNSPKKNSPVKVKISPIKNQIENVSKNLSNEFSTNTSVQKLPRFFQNLRKRLEDASVLCNGNTEKDSNEEICVSEQESVLHKEDTPNDASNATTDSKLLPPSPQSSVSMNFPVWKNKEALCWLDATLSLLVHNKKLQGFFKYNNSNVCQLEKVFKDYERSLNLVNGILQDSRKRKRKQSPARLLIVNKMLEAVRESTFNFLQPRLQCEKGKEETPVFAVPLLLRENKEINELFLLNYKLELQCESCNAFKSDQYKKTVLTFPKVGSNFTLPEGFFLRPCLNCNIPDQKMYLHLEKFPESVLVHFMNGLPNSQVSSYDFTHLNQWYRVTGVVQYSLKPRHFVTWIRNPKDESWLCCDDLKPGLQAYSPKPPLIPASELHILMWERSEQFLNNNQENVAAVMPTLCKPEAISSQPNRITIQPLIVTLDDLESPSVTEPRIISQPESFYIQDSKKDVSQTEYANQPPNTMACTDNAKTLDFNHSLVNKPSNEEAVKCQDTNTSQDLFSRTCQPFMLPNSEKSCILDSEKSTNGQIIENSLNKVSGELDYGTNQRIEGAENVSDVNESFGLILPTFESSFKKLPSLSQHSSTFLDTYEANISKLENEIHVKETQLSVSIPDKGSNQENIALGLFLTTMETKPILPVQKLSDQVNDFPETITQLETLVPSASSQLMASHTMETIANGSDSLNVYSVQNDSVIKECNITSGSDIKSRKKVNELVEEQSASIKDVLTSITYGKLLAGNQKTTDNTHYLEQEQFSKSLKSDESDIPSANEDCNKYVKSLNDRGLSATHILDNSDDISNSSGYPDSVYNSPIGTQDSDQEYLPSQKADGESTDKKNSPFDLCSTSERDKYGALNLTVADKDVCNETSEPCSLTRVASVPYLENGINKCESGTIFTMEKTLNKTPGQPKKLHMFDEIETESQKQLKSQGKPKSKKQVLHTTPKSKKQLLHTTKSKKQALPKTPKTKKQALPKTPKTKKQALSTTPKSKKQALPKRPKSKKQALHTMALKSKQLCNEKTAKSNLIINDNELLKPITFCLPPGKIARIVSQDGKCISEVKFPATGQDGNGENAYLVERPNGVKFLFLSKNTKNETAPKTQESSVISYQFSADNKNTALSNKSAKLSENEVISYQFSADNKNTALSNKSAKLSENEVIAVKINTESSLSTNKENQPATTKVSQTDANCINKLLPEVSTVANEVKSVQLLKEMMADLKNELPVPQTNKLINSQSNRNQSSTASNSYINFENITSPAKSKRTLDSVAEEYLLHLLSDNYSNKRGLKRSQNTVSRSMQDALYSTSTKSKTEQMLNIHSVSPENQSGLSAKKRIYQKKSKKNSDVQNESTQNRSQPSAICSEDLNNLSYSKQLLDGINALYNSFQQPCQKGKRKRNPPKTTNKRRKKSKSALPSPELAAQNAAQNSKNQLCTQTNTNAENSTSPSFYDKQDEVCFENDAPIIETLNKVAFPSNNLAQSIDKTVQIRCASKVSKGSNQITVKTLKENTIPEQRPSSKKSKSKEVNETKFSNSIINENTETSASTLPFIKKGKTKKNSPKTAKNQQKVSENLIPSPESAIEHAEQSSNNQPCRHTNANAENIISMSSEYDELALIRACIENDASVRETLNKAAFPSNSLAQNSDKTIKIKCASKVSKGSNQITVETSKENTIPKQKPSSKKSKSEKVDETKLSNNIINENTETSVNTVPCIKKGKMKKNPPKTSKIQQKKSKNSVPSPEPTTHPGQSCDNQPCRYINENAANIVFMSSDYNELSLIRSCIEKDSSVTVDKVSLPSNSSTHTT